MTISAPQGAGDLHEFPAGTVFAGKYCVERMIGRGGMGAVLVARHMDLGHRVAIKVLHESLASDPRATERFQREARASVRLESEHVAHVSDVGTDHGTSYMTMEYLEGEDLASILKVRGRIPQKEAVSWMLEACDAVAEAHSQGIIHRDLKPANLFLARRKRGAAQIKVLDFGISKTTVKSRNHDLEEELTETQAIVGTPHYASPEQLRGDQGLDARSDIWSLGVLLHRLLSGGRPFEADTSSGLIAAIAADPPTPVRAAAPDVSPEIETIILRCLEKNPDNRFRDIAELARALAPFAAPEQRQMVSHIEKLRQSIAPEPSTRRQPGTAAQSLRELLSSSGNGAHTLKRPSQRESALPLPLLALVGGVAAISAILVAVVQAQRSWGNDRPALSVQSHDSALVQEKPSHASKGVVEVAPLTSPTAAPSPTSASLQVAAALEDPGEQESAPTEAPVPPQKTAPTRTASSKAGTPRPVSSASLTPRASSSVSSPQPTLDTKTSPGTRALPAIVEQDPYAEN